LKTIVLKLVLADYVCNRLLPAKFIPVNWMGMSTNLAIASVLAIATLVLCFWRMAVGSVASRPVSEHLRQALKLNHAEGSAEFGPSDFRILESLCSATGALSDARAIGPIRAYYGFVRGIGLLFPALAYWSRREMTLCSRYLAARVDRQLSSNIVCSQSRY
jgi:hypothetical protein